MSCNIYRTHFKEIIDYNKHLAFADTVEDAEIICDKLNELDHEIDRLCHCDDDANEEYFKRDAIVGEVNYLASNANRELGILDEGTSSYYECLGKIKVLNQLQVKINEVLY